MSDAHPRAHATTRAMRRVAFFALVLLIALIAGCERNVEEPPLAHPVDDSRVRIVAWLDEDSPCHAGTVEILSGLEQEAPNQLSLRVVDIGTPEGLERLAQRGFDDTAIEINDHVAVTWGEGDDRRTVCFMHPPGFTWTHDDLRAAIRAALDGTLLPADPVEAEGVRLMDVSTRGQSIRIGDEGEETGQLVIQDQIVLEITESHEDLLPGQRVSVAADALAEVLQKPFTPNRLRLTQEAGGVAVIACETPLLVATETDAAARDVSPEQLAEQWRLALRTALIDAALKRAAAPALKPEPVLDPSTADAVDLPEDALPDALLPTPN